MTRKKLESYRANKRLIERNKQRIENEKCKNIPIVQGKVKGSSHDFPYTMQRFSVQISEPVEADRSRKRISTWRREIELAEKEMEEVEQFVSAVENVRDREILSYRYIDGMKTVDVGKKVGYTHGRVSQIISKYLKD